MKRLISSVMTFAILGAAFLASPPRLEKVHPNKAFVSHRLNFEIQKALAASSDYPHMGPMFRWLVTVDYENAEYVAGNCSNVFNSVSMLMGILCYMIKEMNADLKTNGSYTGTGSEVEGFVTIVEDNDGSWVSATTYNKIVRVTYNDKEFLIYAYSTADGGGKGALDFLINYPNGEGDDRSAISMTWDAVTDATAATIDMRYFGGGSDRTWANRNMAIHATATIHTTEETANEMIAVNNSVAQDTSYKLAMYEDTTDYHLGYGAQCNAAGASCSTPSAAYQCAQDTSSFDPNGNGPQQGTLVDSGTTQALATDESYCTGGASVSLDLSAADVSESNLHVFGRSGFRYPNGAL